MSETVKRALDAARKLVAAVSFDDSGALVAGQWVGGNGGLLSRDTIKAADECRTALNAIRATGDSQ